ncbi:MAG: hypothetical protein M1515_03175 [Candidatus Thermoplasmatota archaeon]|jgi:hypothetical protein|nr:hypothetical protein [Candidatus Thermoplasmatota archaeon]
MEPDYDRIFTSIKRMVSRNIRKERTVGLALSSFDSQVGAFWVDGGNYITLNRNVVEAMDANQRNLQEKKALVTVLLMHEYIHSLGFGSEIAARDLTAKIIEREMGRESLEYSIAESGPWNVFPFLSEYRGRISERIDIVNRFGSRDTDYIG